ncbi:hypothetical protein EI94DRAFT_1765724, partial [Lactarius quietus]
CSLSLAGHSPLLSPSFATAVPPPRTPVSWGITASDMHQPARHCHCRCRPPLSLDISYHHCIATQATTATTSRTRKTMPAKYNCKSAMAATM